MEIYEELEKLINDRYVEKIAGKYYKYVPDDRKGLITIEDIVSAGHEGLLEAAQKYKPGSKAKLSSYAYPWIKGRIIDELIFYIGKDALLFGDEEWARISSGEKRVEEEATTDMDISAISREEQVRIIKGKLKEFGLAEEEIHVYLAVNGVGRDKVTNMGVLARELKTRESKVRLFKQRAEEKVKNGR